MRRGGADWESCSCFVIVGVNQADARFTCVRHHYPLSIWTDGEEVWISPDTDRGDNAMIAAIPYRQIVGRKIGDIAVAPVRAERGKMRAFAGGNRRHDFMIARPDDRHVIRN